MDNLSYRYKTQSVGTTTRQSNNMLLSYSDLQAYASRYDDDVDGYGLAFDVNDPGTWCYKYDEIGNLIQDNSEQIANIEWDAYGKIKKITRSTGSTKADLEFIYDPMGTRVGKILKPRTVIGLQNEDQWTYTWYTHDAQGQTLATHTMTYEPAGSRYTAIYRADEEYLFGSSRLGALLMSEIPEKTREFNYNGYMEDGRFNITSWVSESISSADLCQSHCVVAHTATIGNRRYELKDHLGNVWATVSDAKSYSGGNFVAEITSAQSYYPFGSLQPGRNFNAGDYRFGFNGKENDNEVKGTGNQQDYGMRIYDPRLGRFLSADPLIVQEQKYPELSAYQFASNTPIKCIDIDGLESGYVKPDGTVVSGSDQTHNYNPSSTDASAQPTLNQNNVNVGTPQINHPPSNTMTISQAQSNYEKFLNIAIAPETENTVKYDPFVKSIAVVGLISTPILMSPSIPAIQATAINLESAFAQSLTVQFAAGVGYSFLSDKINLPPDIPMPTPMMQFGSDFTSLTGYFLKELDKMNQQQSSTFQTNTTSNNVNEYVVKKSNQSTTANQQSATSHAAVKGKSRLARAMSSGGSN